MWAGCDNVMKLRSELIAEVTENSVLDWSPLDVVDHHELHLHTPALQLQP
jgi:hypothetical protein